jgi:hypothetical protein
VSLHKARASLPLDGYYPAAGCADLKASLKCRSCRKGRSDTPVWVIKLTEAGRITRHYGFIRQRALGTGKRASGLTRFGGSVMSRLRYRLWTEKDLERLRALVLSGASAVRASVALKRPLKGVKSRAREIGVSFKHDSELK